MAKKLLIVCFSCLLSACGAKGDLFLPTEPPEQQYKEKKKLAAKHESAKKPTKKSSQDILEQPQS